MSRVRILIKQSKFVFSHYSIKQVCLTRLGRIALFRTAATSSTTKKQVSKVGEEQSMKLKGKVEPELVEPVINWLLDDTAEQPFIPVTGM